MKIRKSVRSYERWLRAQLKGELVEKDIDRKHSLMAQDAFPFLRATYWRWAEIILDICPELSDAPVVLAIGDIHIENYGSWRDAEGRVVWGVNDFDEAADMPYALDLVRLATSAVLAEVRGMGEGAVCRNVLAGYRAGLARPRPFVLDRQHHWLREKVVVPEPDRKKFWTKYDPAKNKTRHRIPRAYRKALQTTLPSECADVTYWPRTAGMGSLGRPRWVGFAIWQGAPVVREANAGAFARPFGAGEVRLDAAPLRGSGVRPLSFAQSAIFGPARHCGAAALAERSQDRTARAYRGSAPQGLRRAPGLRKCENAGRDGRRSRGDPSRHRQSPEGDRERPAQARRRVAAPRGRGGGRARAPRAARVDEGCAQILTCADDGD